MAGIRGYNGWRWIFIIEGLATVLVAIIAKFLIVDWPEQAKFLNDEERQRLLKRVSEDISDVRMDRFDAKARRRAFGDWKPYLGCVATCTQPFDSWSSIDDSKGIHVHGNWHWRVRFSILCSHGQSAFALSSSQIP